MYSVDLYMTHTHTGRRANNRAHTHARHAFTHTHTRACMHERAHTRTHTHAQTLTCAYANARVHACAHARAYAHASAHTHTNTHTAHKTHKHACMDLCAHTHAHAHTRIHLQMSRVHVVACVFYICRSSIQSHDASCEIWSPVSAKKNARFLFLVLSQLRPRPPNVQCCCGSQRVLFTKSGVYFAAAKPPSARSNIEHRGGRGVSVIGLSLFGRAFISQIPESISDGSGFWRRDQP